jgi:DNA-binding MarR family transcriptional regulator
MPALGAVDTARAADAALTIIRLFRSMERVEAGLTPQQYRMLKLIGAGGERSAKLAERLAVAKPTLTSTADGLVAAGLLYRETETSDRRVVRLRLTEAGRAAVDRADAVYADWLGGLLAEAGEPGRLLEDLSLIDRAIDQRIAAKHAAAELARGSGEVVSRSRHGQRGPHGQRGRHGRPHMTT